jgi:hypothetical protein
MLFYAIFWVIVFWLVIHVLHHTSGRLGQRSPSLLPAPFSSGGRQVHNVILGVAHLRVETTRYNARLSELPFILDGRLRSPLKSFYNGGGLLGVVGMIGSVVVLLWQAYNLIFGTRLMQTPAPRIVKRNAETMAEPQGDASYLHSMVVLIIEPILGMSLTIFIDSWPDHPTCGLSIYSHRSILIANIP